MWPRHIHRRRGRPAAELRRARARLEAPAPGSGPCGARAGSRSYQDFQGEIIMTDPLGGTKPRGKEKKHPVDWPGPAHVEPLQAISADWDRRANQSLDPKEF